MVYHHNILVRNFDCGIKFFILLIFVDFFLIAHLLMSFLLIVLIDLIKLHILKFDYRFQLYWALVYEFDHMVCLELELGQSDYNFFEHNDYKDYWMVAYLLDSY